MITFLATVGGIVVAIVLVALLLIVHAVITDKEIPLTGGR